MVYDEWIDADTTYDLEFENTFERLSKSFDL